MALKILLADDSMTAQNMGKKILTEAGYDIIAVSNGAAALKKIAELKPNQHKKLFAKLDAILDRAEIGPRWLGDTEVAALVENALLRRYAELYGLWAYVVMVNHLHLLLRPKSNRSAERDSGRCICVTEHHYKEHKGLHYARSEPHTEKDW